TGGKSLSRSNGRHASTIAREFQYALAPRGIIGSSGVLQPCRTKSMSSTGSHRVQTAHMTSNRSVGSTSSSTTITKRPRYDPAEQFAASIAACFACPACDCLIEMTLNIFEQPTSWHQTPCTPESPAASTSSQIIPASTAHLPNI